jgi:hypothetical protein
MYKVYKLGNQFFPQDVKSYGTVVSTHNSKAEAEAEAEKLFNSDADEAEEFGGTIGHRYLVEA